MKKTLADKITISITDEKDINLEYLSEKEISQLHSILLEMYEDIKRVCNKYGLNLIAAGGTSIGAVRHGGFIPWDDDMDLFMLREEYEKLKSVFDKELGEKYYLIAPKSKQGVNAFLPRIMKKGTELVTIENEADPYPKGVYIDINLLENAPKRAIILRAKGIIADMLRFISFSVYMYKYNGETFKKTYLTSEFLSKYYKIRLALGRFFSFCSPEKWFEIFDNFVNSNNKTGYYTVPSGKRGYIGEYLSQDIVFPLKELQFENSTIYVLNDYDAYLKNIYGEYMNIPPKEKRERHSYIKVIFNDNGGKS